MKIIALLPFKNEAWILPTYLSSVSKIADKIIALDDNSTDKGADILKEAGAEVITLNTKSETFVNMSLRRQKLLEAGRKAGGTHFIWLDADETFSANFIPRAREVIAKLSPGQKMTLRWINFWGNEEHYLNDKKSPLGYIWKDFIYCDDGKDEFINKSISESRTPGNTLNTLKLDETTGVILHWAYSDWETVQHKQAWYQCVELIEGKRSPFRINVSYSFTKKYSGLETKLVPDHWMDGIVKPINHRGKFHLKQIEEFFQTYGIKYFERLDIWHISELEKKFIIQEGRKPIPHRPSEWFIKINNIKNNFREYIHKYI